MRPSMRFCLFRGFESVQERSSAINPAESLPSPIRVVELQVDTTVSSRNPAWSFEREAQHLAFSKSSSLRFMEKKEVAT